MTNFLLSPANDASLHRLSQATTPVPASSPHGQDTVHVLEPGQSPEEVASLHGVTEQALRMENGLGPGQAVYPGTPLRIPMPATSDSDSTEQTQAVGFAPFDAGSDHTNSPDDVAIWVPDFKSMSPADIQKYLESSEFKQMAASEREVAERLYNAGMRQAAMDYLATSMKSLPAEVAARLAEECKELIGQLAKDPDVNKQMYAILTEMTSSLMKSPGGQELLREFARNLAGTMTEEQALKFPGSIHEGAPGGEPLKILVLKALLARIESGTLPEAQKVGLRNAVTDLANEVYQHYWSSQAAKASKDAEFAAMLARLGNGLTSAQKEELYQKFINDPENAAVYDAAEKAAVPMADVVSVAAAEVVAMLANSYKLSDIPDLISGLSRYGQGIAAIHVVFAAKANADVLAQLTKTGVDMAALERTAGVSAIAQATIQSGGDVEGGLNALLDALKGVLVDDISGFIGKLKTIIGVFQKDEYPDANELTGILDKAGPYRNLFGGILSMAVTLTASNPTEVKSSMEALFGLGKNAADAASGIASILGYFASKTSRLANLGMALENTALVMSRISTSLGLILTAMSVGESLERQMMNGELNLADMFNIVNGLVAIAAAVPTPASPFLAFAALILSVAGEVISSAVDEQEMRATVKKYLVEIGVDEYAAGVLAANPDSIKQLADAGFDPQQIQLLATNHPWIFGDEGIQHGVAELARALSASGIDHARVIELFDSLPLDELQRFLQTVGMEQDAKSWLSNATDREGLVAALEHIAQQINLPESVRETAHLILEWASRQ